MKITNNPEQVKKITGHLSDRIFNRYVGANKEDMKKIKNMWDESKLKTKDDEVIKKTDEDMTIELLNIRRSRGEITNEQFLNIVSELLVKKES
jgi:hypothetical protein